MAGDAKTLRNNLWPRVGGVIFEVVLSIILVLVCVPALVMSLRVDLSAGGVLG